MNTFREWWKVNRPIFTFLKHLFTLITFGWNFPCIKWWRNRPEVRARIERRHSAYRYFFRLIQLLVRLVLRSVVKIVTRGKYPKRPFLWDREA